MSLPGSVSPSPTPSPGATTRPGRPQKSSVWGYFTYDATEKHSVCLVEVTGMTDEPGPSAVYQACNHKIPGKFPTNLKTHIKKSHPGVYQVLLEKERANVEAKKEAEVAVAICPQKQLTLADAASTGKWWWISCGYVCGFCMKWTSMTCSCII